MPGFPPSFLKRQVPLALRGWVRDFRELDAAGRRALVRVTLLRATGWRRDRLPPAPAGGGHAVLFVCHGNIMRSAFGAALLRARLSTDAAQVWSAGTHARDGRAADPRAMVAAAEHGVTLDAHRACAITAELVARASVVLVMDRRNEANVVARFPDAARKVVRLGALAAPDRADGAVLPDPYPGDDTAVRASFARIAAAVEALAAHLRTR